MSIAVSCIEYTMLTHYFKTACRNLYRNKLHWMITILGLSTGIAATLLLAKYVGFNLTFDNFHRNKDRIFQVLQKESKGGVETPQQTHTYWGVAKMTADLYPEVNLTTHFTSNVEMLVTASTQGGGTVSFNENRICTVDTSFFSIFSFSSIAGDMATALSIPNAIVLTKSTAEKYFGSSDPIGQILTTRVSWGAENSHVVTCVIPDIPINSSLQFDLLICAGTGPPTEVYWTDPSYGTYLLLDEAADSEVLATKMSRDIGMNRVATAGGKQIEFSLKRLSDTPLASNDTMLVWVGVFVLIISWINFINLSVGNAQSRSKEAAIRKVIGASRKQMVIQFTFESLLTNGISILLAAIIFTLARPSLLQFTNGKVLPLFNDPTPVNWIFAAVFFTGVLISSGYSAMMISSLNPVRSLKGKVNQGRYTLTFRKGLMIIQFTVSIIALIGVFIVSDQLDYFHRYDLKINLNRIVSIKGPKDRMEGKAERLISFKNEVMQLAMVENVASSTTTPGEDYRHEVNFSRLSDNDRHLFYLNDVDASFFPLYDVAFLAGENYSSDTPAKNRMGIVLNEAAANALGFAQNEDAIGQLVTEMENNNTYEIIGIVTNYHQLSLKHQIKPQAFRFNRSRGSISVKINAENYASFKDVRNCITALEELWDKTYPDQPFEYHFLDTRFNHQYADEYNFRNLFAWLTALSLIITCLGLFSLCSFISLKRKKEVGVRKLFGASSMTIWRLLARSYLIQMLVSIVLAVPIAYLIMNAWLENFNIKTKMMVDTFATPCLILGIVTMLTTAYETVRASVASPLATLKED